MTKTRTLKEWLESFGHFNVKPVRITITAGKITHTYEGAEYQSKHFAGDTRMLLVTPDGDLPGRNRENYGEGHAYQRDGCQNEWFVAGYATKLLAEKDPVNNPFGATVVFSEWKHAEKIDQYEARPYKRLKMQVQYL